MKTKVLQCLVISSLCALMACPAGWSTTLADNMKKLVGFTVGAVAHIINTERDERTGLMRVQLSNGMIFALRVADDQLIDTSSGDTVVCFRQIPFAGVEHRLVIEDDVYAAQRLQ